MTRIFKIIDEGTCQRPCYMVRERCPAGSYGPVWEIRWAFPTLEAAEHAAREHGDLHPDSLTTADEWRKQADHIDGYDRDDLGESPDY